MGTHCHNQLPPTYISSSNQMLMVMRTDSIISAKGFKAWYTKACGARIIVKDHGFLTPSSDYNLENCTWTLIAEDPGNKCELLSSTLRTSVFFSKRFIYLPSNFLDIVAADHVTISFTHMEIDPFGVNLRMNSSLGPCSLEYVQVFEGEDMNDRPLGKWCNNITPPPITSTGSSLTVHLYNVNEESLSHFALTYSVLNTGTTD